MNGNRFSEELSFYVTAPIVGLWLRVEPISTSGFDATPHPYDPTIPTRIGGPQGGRIPRRDEAVPMRPARIRRQQKASITRRRNVRYATDLTNPDFVAFARACGGIGISVKKPEELEPAWDEAFAVDGPVL